MQDKFEKASRFVVSSQIWMNTIPTRDCDVLVTFPKDATTETLQWVLSQIKTHVSDIKLYVRYHTNTRQYGFYFSADFESLLSTAEELGIQKRVLVEYGGGIKEYNNNDRDCFEGVEDPTSFFTSQERRSCVKHMLDNLRATEGDCLFNVKFHEGQAILPILQSKRIIDQILPLHNTEDMTYLREYWMKCLFKWQPLDKVCEYFGVKIAMYFAYLGHYTISLLLPTLIGILLWFISGSSQETDDCCFVIFAFLNVVWATLYLEAWKRTSAEFAYKWGTLDLQDELLSEPRPLYHGQLVVSSVTGRPEPYYPAWKRSLFKYLISWPVIGLCLFVVFAVMWCIFELQDWLNAKVKKEELSGPWNFLPKILLAVSIGILDDIYKKIAVWLNKKENYRLQDSYDNNLIVKLVLFQFVNSFLSLFYIAFYLQDMNRLRDQLAMLLITRQVIGNLKESVLPYALGKLKLFRMGYKMTEAMSPGSIEKQAREIIDKRLRTPSECSQQEKEINEKDKEDKSGAEVRSDTVEEERTHSTEAEKLDDLNPLTVFGKDMPENQLGNSGPQLTQAEVEASMKQYEDTFEDHLEMFIQFGYVTLFSSAFPLAALCALLNNIIEIRSDAFKLCMTFQRPFGQNVNSIGTWQDALEVMSVIAVMVNCALIGISDLADRLFPTLSTTQRIVFIVILEHLILTAKFILAYSIPDIPHWVAEAKAKLEFKRRQALKTLERKPRKRKQSHFDRDFADKTSQHGKDENLQKNTHSNLDGQSPELLHNL